MDNIHVPILCCLCDVDAAESSHARAFAAGLAGIRMVQLAGSLRRLDREFSLWRLRGRVLRIHLQPRASSVGQASCSFKKPRARTGEDWVNSRRSALHDGRSAEVLVEINTPVPIWRATAGQYGTPDTEQTLVRFGVALCVDDRQTSSLHARHARCI